jgi:hypothetical protein
MGRLLENMGQMREKVSESGKEWLREEKWDI